MSSQAVAVDMAPDEATGTISVILSCRAPSRQQSITDGQSLIAALEQEERHARGDCTVRQPSRSLTVLCDKDGFQDRYSPCATLSVAEGRKCHKLSWDGTGHVRRWCDKQERISTDRCTQQVLAFSHISCYQYCGICLRLVA